MAIAKVSEKGQLTLPAEIRKKLNIKTGSYLRIAILGEEIRLIPQSQSLSALRGIVKVSGEQDFQAIRGQVMEDISCDKNKGN